MDTIRKEILKEAEKCVCTDRNAQYGEPEDNFGIIARMWAVYVSRFVPNGVPIIIRPEDVAAMMILFKVGRLITSIVPSVDTFIDIAGYAACAGEIATNAGAGRRDSFDESESPVCGSDG